MAEAVFIEDGVGFEYKPTFDVPAGYVVVQDELVGVATRPIPVNTWGLVTVAGVFDFKKGDDAIPVGSQVYWDNNNRKATALATGTKYLGKCVRYAASSDSTVRVRLSQ